MENKPIKIADYHAHAQRQEYISRGLSKCGNQWKCLICNAMYRSRQNAATHIEGKHLADENAYSCQYCSSTFRTQNAYYVHISTIHKEEHKMAKIWGK